MSQGVYVSGRWESNPRLQLGRLRYYHYTTAAITVEQLVYYLFRVSAIKNSRFLY